MATKSRHRKKYSDLADRLRPARRPSPWELRALQTAEYADACRFAGRIEESERAFDELLAEAQTKRNRVLTCVARTGLANAFCARSRWDEATELLRPALADARATRDPLLRARVQCVLASAVFNQGEIEDSQRLLQEALRTAREYEEPRIQVAALTSLGIVALAADDLASAFTSLSQGVALAERTTNDHWAVIGRSYLAIQAHLSGQLNVAAKMYALSLSELESLGIRRALGVCRFAFATLSMLRGDWDQAREVLEQAVSELAVTCPDYEPLLQAAIALCELGAGHRGVRQRLAHARSLCDGDVRRSFVEIVLRIERLDGAKQKRRAPKKDRSIEALLVERVCEALESRKATGSLTLDENASVCRLSGAPGVIDLSRRLPLQRLLRALVIAHESAAGSFVPDDALVREVWPGERITARAARIRLHTTVSMLRTKGLGTLIERSDRGYRLRPDLEIRRVSGDSAELLDEI